MRERGYYWVNYRGTWKIAEFSAEAWFLSGSRMAFCDESFKEIDERRITRE